MNKLKLNSRRQVFKKYGKTIQIQNDRGKLVAFKLVKKLRNFRIVFYCPGLKRLNIVLELEVFLIILVKYVARNVMLKCIIEDL